MQMTFNGFKAFKMAEDNVVSMSFVINEAELELNSHTVYLSTRYNLLPIYYSMDGISLLNIQQLLTYFYSEEDSTVSSQRIFKYFGLKNYRLIQASSDDEIFVKDLFSNTSNSAVPVHEAKYGKSYEKKNWGKGDLKTFLKKKYNISIDKKLFQLPDQLRLDNTTETASADPIFSF